MSELIRLDTQQNFTKDLEWKGSAIHFLLCTCTIKFISLSSKYRYSTKCVCHTFFFLFWRQLYTVCVPDADQHQDVGSKLWMASHFRQVTLSGLVQEAVMCLILSCKTNKLCHVKTGFVVVIPIEGLVGQGSPQSDFWPFFWYVNDNRIVTSL